MFEQIRKYKLLVVCFVALTFLMYMSSYIKHSVGMFEREKTEALSVVKASNIVAVCHIAQNPDRLELGNSSVVKKVSIDRFVFRYIIVGYRFFQRIYMYECHITALSPSVLDLNSILRI